MDGASDKLEVTIIPVDDEPYSKMINIPSSMMGKLKIDNIGINSVANN